MDLTSFERAARVGFSFPSSKGVAALVAAALLVALRAGCPPPFIAYVLAALPLTLRLAAPKVITFRRAYGMVPLFLLWGALLSWLHRIPPLAYLPPSLLMLLPLRFLADSRWKAYLPALVSLAAAAAQGGIAALAAAAALLGAASAAIELYARHLDRQLKPYGGLALLKASLLHRLAGGREALERALLGISTARRVPVYVIDLLDERGVWAMIVVPHVHPGPYDGVGGSRLPALLAQAARTRGFECVVLHGASEHSEDLALSGDAAKLADAVVSGAGEVLCQGRRLGIASSSDGRVRVTALALEGGWSLALAERLDGGMEDIPLALAGSVGPRTILVDLHNSFDEPRPSPSPLDALGQSIIACARTAIELAASNMEEGWSVGVASLHGSWGDEIGGAGISAVAMAREGECTLLVVYDANSMLRSVRDRLYELASGLCARVVVATSDTHEMTGLRARSTYHPLGSRLPLSELWSATANLCLLALQSTRKLHYRLRRVVVEAPFLNPSALDDLARLTTKHVKYALAILALLALFFILPPLL